MSDNIYAAIFGKLKDLRQIAPTIFQEDLSSPLLTDLTAYWKFEDALGTEEVGTVGSATVVGSPAVTTGIQGNCKSNTPTGSFQYSDAVWMDRPNNAFSLAGWIKNPTTANKGFLGKDGSGQIEFAVLIFSGSLLRLQLSADGTAQTNHDYGARVTNKWYFFGMRWDGTLGSNQYKSYVGSEDGEILLTTQSTLASVHNGSAILRLGRSGGLISQDTFIDEFGYWDRALTDAEFSTLYNSGAGTTYPFN